MVVAYVATAGGDKVLPLQPGDLAPPPRQTLFFSATWPKEVQQIARQLCNNDPVRVFVGNVQCDLLHQERSIALVWKPQHDMDANNWAAAVHGDKSQAERDAALSAFRRGLVPVLVATDVAARGLDIPGVSSVVNYEFPSDHDMYVHRIGRTGRAGRKGESLTLLTPEDTSVTPVLVDIMKGANQHVPEELEAVAARELSHALVRATGAQNICGMVA
eukprot:gene12356-12490_t